MDLTRKTDRYDSRERKHIGIRKGKDDKVIKEKIRITNYGAEKRQIEVTPYVKGGVYHMNTLFTIQDVDEHMLNYVNAYIKQVINNAQKHYFSVSRKHIKYDISFEPYCDEICYSEDNIIHNDYHILAFENIALFQIESEPLYRELMKLTAKQKEVILKSIVLDIPMESVATQMGISVGKAYKHRRNALIRLREGLKRDE